MHGALLVSHVEELPQRSERPPQGQLQAAAGAGGPQEVEVQGRIEEAPVLHLLEVSEAQIGKVCFMRDMEFLHVCSLCHRICVNGVVTNKETLKVN